MSLKLKSKTFSDCVLKKLEGHSSDLVTHYTNSGGLAGIAGSRVLRLTEIRYQNDATEAKILLDVLDNYIRRHIVSLTHEAFPDATGTQRAAVINAAREWFEASQFNTDSNYGTFAFAASFSASEDLLSQWRGYGQDGNAYSLSFVCSNIKTAALNSDLEFVFLPCLYGARGSKDLEKICAEIFLDVWSVFTSEVEFTDDGYLGVPNTSAAIDAWAKELIIMSLFVKHESFKEEEEFRLAICGSYNELEGRIGVKESARGLVPFVSFDLGDLVSPSEPATVWIGPTQESQVHANMTVSKLFKDNGWGYVTVRHSVSPYRGIR